MTDPYRGATTPFPNINVSGLKLLDAAETLFWEKAILAVELSPIPVGPNGGMRIDDVARRADELTNSR